MANLKTCDNCRHCCCDGPSHDQPYPSQWCSAGHWDGLGQEDLTDDLVEETDCTDWEKRAVVKMAKSKPLTPEQEELHLSIGFYYGVGEVSK